VVNQHGGKNKQEKYPSWDFKGGKITPTKRYKWGGRWKKKGTRPHQKPSGFNIWFEEKTTKTVTTRRDEWRVWFFVDPLGGGVNMGSH